MGKIWTDQWFCLERSYGIVWSDATVLFGATDGIRFNREENIPEKESG